MTKLDEKNLIDYVINNGATLKQASEHFGVSISTIKKAMKRIKENLSQDSDIYIKINDIARKNELLGKKKGGESCNSGKERKLSMDQIVLFAMKFIAENMTIETASISFGIPRSTLWENFNLLNCEEYQELYNDLLYVYSWHNKGISNDYFLNDIEEVKLNRNNHWLAPIQQNDAIHLESLMAKYNLKLEEISNHKSK